jgi:hypothetical protein
MVLAKDVTSLGATSGIGKATCGSGFDGATP